MITLKAPAGTSSFSHEGVETPVPANGLVEVPEHVAAILASHGFKPHDTSKIVGISKELDEKLGDAFDHVDSQFDSQGRLIGGLSEKIDALDRKGLFRALKAMGVVASATLKTDELESIYEAEAKKRDDAAMAAAQPEPEQKPSEG